MGSDERLYCNASLIVRDKVTRQCPQTTTSEERSAQAESNQGPSAYQPNTLPLGQAGHAIRETERESVCVRVYVGVRACVRVFAPLSIITAIPIKGETPVWTLLLCLLAIVGISV